MEKYSHLVDLRPSLMLPQTDECILLPIGDLHYPYLDEERLKRHLDWGLSHGAYFLGMGDYLDFGSPTSRSKLQGADLYDTVYQSIENMAEEYLEDLMDLLLPTRGRWLGLLEGHHFWEFSTGRTSDQMLADTLNCPFLGTTAWPLTLDLSGHGECVVWAAHGSGSGIAAGSGIRYLETRILPYFDADVYLLGHRHVKEAVKRPLMTTEGYTNRVLAVTGGFFQGYDHGTQFRGRPQGSYVEKKLLPPTTLGGIGLYIRPRSDGTIDLDVLL